MPTVTNAQRVYQLPEDTSYRLFESFGNAAILKKDAANAIFDGYGVVDSVDLKGRRPLEDKIREVDDLILRNGGKFVGTAPRPL